MICTVITSLTGRLSAHWSSLIVQQCLFSSPLAVLTESKANSSQRFDMKMHLSVSLGGKELIWQMASQKGEKKGGRGAVNPGEYLYTGCVNSAAAAQTSQLLYHPLALQRKRDREEWGKNNSWYKCHSWPCCPAVHICVLKSGAPEVTSLFVWINSIYSFLNITFKDFSLSRPKSLI